MPREEWAACWDEGVAHQKKGVALGERLAALELNCPAPWKHDALRQEPFSLYLAAR